MYESLWNSCSITVDVSVVQIKYVRDKPTSHFEIVFFYSSFVQNVCDKSNHRGLRGEIIMQQAPEWVRTSDSVIIVQHINLGTDLLIVYSVCMGKKSIRSHNAWYTRMRVVSTTCTPMAMSIIIPNHIILMGAYYRSTKLCMDIPNVHRNISQSPSLDNKLDVYVSPLDQTASHYMHYIH